MTVRRAAGIISALIGALVALQFLTYGFLASSAIPPLALNWTPERHFVPGTVFTWVWLERDLCRNLSESQVARLRASLERRYRTVYEGREAVPDSLLYLYENGSVAGLKHGFALGLSVVSRRLFMVKVRHHDFEGNLAASSGDHVYVWILGRWWKLRDENMAIA